MTNVVTVYCCGTNKHRDMETYLIGNLFRLDSADPQSDTECGGKYIVDGPGSSHAIAKTKGIIDKVNRNDPKGYKFNAQTGQAKSYGLLGRASGLVSGTGWADNVYEVQQWLLLVDAKLKKTHPRGIERVNLIGHSRGAVTCTMIAHMMHKTNPAWEANIIALDPVPGSDAASFRAEKDTIGDLYDLPPNVRHYFAMLMEHVSSGSAKDIRFQPVFLEKMKFHSAVNLHFTELALPGKHGDLAKYEEQEVPLWKISASNCIEYLTRLGSQFTPQGNQLVMNAAQVLEQYAAVHLQRIDELLPKKASSLGSHWTISEEWANDRGTQVRNPVVDHPYYINLQHANAFGECCHEIAQRLDRRQPVTSQELTAMPRNFFQHYPLTVQLMWKLGFVTDAPLANHVWLGLCNYKKEASGWFTRQSDESTRAINAIRGMLSSPDTIPIDNILAPTVRWLCGLAPLAPSLRTQTHLRDLQPLKSGGRLHGILMTALKEWEGQNPRFYR